MAEKKFSIRALLFGDVRDFKKGMDQAKKSSNSFKGVLGNVGKTLKGLASSTLGFAAILYGAGKALMSIVRNNKDFQQSLSSLSAITGLTGEDLNFFAEQAKKTSKVTLQSANNIVKAYELIGSKRPELLQNKEALAEVTKQAIILSEATGGKLALEDAAKTLTTVMNQMNQSAAESGRIINIVAAGSQKGSADALYLSEAFEKAGTTANIMGLSVEETTGAFEALAPFFSKASVLGNSFDKVLLKLREKNIGFTNGVFDMNDAIDQLRIKYEQGQSAADIFGVEHAKLAELLVINQKEFNTYTEAVTDTTIALEQQATQNDNLANNWKRLVNIVQSATLSSSGTGVLNSIVKGLIKATLAVQDFRNLFVENFNELIRKSSVFRAVFAVVTEALKLNFKGIIDSTLLVIEPFLLLGRVVKDVLTGNFSGLKTTITEGLGKIKDRAIDLKDDFVDFGKNVSNAFKTDQIDKFLIATKKVEDSPISLTSDPVSNTSTTSSNVSKVSEEQIKAKKNAIYEIEKLEEDYHRSQESFNESEILNNERTYNAIIEMAIAAGVEKERIAELEALRDKQTNDIILKQADKKRKEDLENEKKFQDEKYNLKKQFGTRKEIYEIEKQELKNLYSQNLIITEEYLREVRKLEANYRAEILDNISGKLSDLNSVGNSVGQTIGWIWGTENREKAEVYTEAISNMVNGLNNLINIFQFLNNLVEGFNKVMKISEGVITAVTAAKNREAVASVANAGASATEAASDASGAIAKSAKSSAAIPIIGGIAAVAIVGLLAAALINANNSVKSNVELASGGIATGPTNALIGEYAGARQDPEAVLKISKLQSMIDWNSGSGSGGEVKFKIDGRELVGVLSNQNNKNRSFKGR